MVKGLGFTETGITLADSSDNFNPASALLRSDMAVMLTRAEGWTEIAEDIFNDVDDHSVRDYILKAVYAGIFEGYPDGTFRPSGTATRYEMVTALVRYLLGEEPTDDMWEEIVVSFTDVSHTHWAFKYVALATAGYDALPEVADEVTDSD